MKKILFFVSLFASTVATAQNVGINGTGALPDASSMLDVSSTTKGFLTPRMTVADRNAIATPATGLLIYQTDNTPGFYYFNGIAWVQAVGPAGPAGANGSLSAGTAAGNTTYWNGTTWVLNSANIYNNGANVGIGTVAPTQKLHVDGNLMMTNSTNGVMLNSADRPLITRGWDAFTSGGYSGLGRWGLFMEASTLVLGTPNLANNGNLAFRRFNLDGTSTTTMFMNSLGYMGIGTSTPGASLNVIHPTASTTPTKPAGNWAAIIENNQDGNDARNGLSVVTRWGGPESKIFEVASYWNGSAQAYTPAMTVLGNRYVGIGTANPGAKLQIDHNSASTWGTAILLNESAAGNSDGAKIGFDKYTPDKRWTIGLLNGAAETGFSVNEDGGINGYGTPRMYWQAGGNIGIGTTTPVAKLDVAGSIKVGGGTVFNSMQGGQATIGAGAGGVKTFTITFPTAFAAPPVVVATPYGDLTYNDTFTCTVKQISTTQFVVNIYRTDSAGAAWGQNLKLNWYAFQ